VPAPVILGTVSDTLLVVDTRGRFEVLYRSHAGAVRTYVRRRSDAQTADDVVADVFVIAWRRLGDVPDDPLPWLLGVARRLLANRRRGWARDQALRDRMMFEQAADGPSAPEPDDAVFRALSGLSERDREALLLVGWEGLEPAQAARVLGVRPNTFAARLYRARRRLARALADADSGHADNRCGSVKAEVLP
jgi:RNA polymerase sigma-70 factor, ECF subfamily